MPLQYSRALLIADAVVTVSNEAAKLLARVHTALEHNSDHAVLWSMPATFNFTAANATNIFTATAHGQTNGQKVRVSSSGVLPAGLVAGTDYFIVTANTNTFQLSLTEGGAVVDITTDGTGTHTLQPVPAYINLEANGNLKDRTFSPADVSNAIGSLDWIRKLLTNQVMTGSQGDHLGNINKLAGPLG